MESYRDTKSTNRDRREPLQLSRWNSLPPPNRLIKSEIALWWRTDALHAGAESDTRIRSVKSAPNDQTSIFLWHWTHCTVLQARGRQLHYKMPTVVMHPDRIPLGMAGVSESSRICPPASCEALASTLPGSRQKQLPRSCCELCNTGVYSEGALHVETQTRT